MLLLNFLEGMYQDPSLLVLLLKDLSHLSNVFINID
jgi:hypothetical protein